MGGESRSHSEGREKEDNEVMLHQVAVLCHSNMVQHVKFHWLHSILTVMNKRA